MEKVINIMSWNIALTGEIESEINFLLSKVHLDIPTIIILQEVTEKRYEYIKENIKDFNSEYSLVFRPKGKYEGKNRTLGICILYSTHFKFMESELFQRIPFPERSLYVKLLIDDKVLGIAGFHSITGCGYKEAKSAQFLTMAEYIDEEIIDIIGFDANEPKVDRGNVFENIYFQQKKNDKGAKTFFESLYNNGLRDAFVPEDDSIEPLAISHIVNKQKRRYDYIFCNEKFQVKYMRYLYDESIKAGSDHALLICKIAIIEKFTKNK